MDHMFKSNVRKCPHCQHPWDGKYSANVFVGNLASLVPRACPKSTRGCNFVGTLDQLTSHTERCEYEYEECPNATLGCQDVVLKKHMLRHRQTCAYFPCKARLGGCGCPCVMKCEEIQHHQATCQYMNNPLLLSTIHRLNESGKLSKQHKSVCFLNNNEKKWNHKVRALKRKGVPLEEEDVEKKLVCVDKQNLLDFAF